MMVRLARRNRLYIVDLRGHGQSAHPPGGYDLEDYADDLERVVAYAGLNPIVLGHSLGGLVAITWAKRHPGQARAIVLEDMPLSGGPDRAPTMDKWARRAAMPIPEVIEEYRRDFPHWSQADYERRAWMITSTEQAVFTSIRDRAADGQQIDYLAGLEAITAPTMLIYGDLEHGALVPEEGAARFRNLAPNFSAVRIPGASHSIHRDSTTQFLDALTDFLDRV